MVSLSLGSAITNHLYVKDYLERFHPVEGGVVYLYYLTADCGG